MNHEKHEKHEKKRTGLVPKLRFLEFRDSGEWVERKLGEITISVSKKNKEGIKYPIYSINNIVGFLPQNKQFEGVDSNNRGYDINLYKVIEKHTFAYNPARINVGSIGYSGVLHNIIISSLYVCFKTKKELDDQFLQVFFETFNFTRSVKDNVEGGIRSYLFYESFSRIPIPLPPLRNEQQKIADCFTSLDELITAEAGKLEAYKAHKKGLMQKLFPTEGKTVPEWRFPEFLDKGEWEESRLEYICPMQAGKFVTASDIKEKPEYSLYPCFGGNGLRGFTKTYTHTGKYPLIGRQGALCGNVTLAEGKFHATEHAIVTKPMQNIDTYWLYYLLTHLNLNQYATGQAQPGLSVDNLKKVPIRVPEKEQEQQKIADCLTSLDELIAVQIQKIDALKAHKKGLMQGLFPYADEVGV